MFNLPHRRWNALTGDPILVSPHRGQRPWQGRTEADPAAPRPRFDPACYLCPGNARANGARNPDYAGTFAFDNDFAALTALDPDSTGSYHAGLLRAQAESGVCRVMCFSPRHDLTLAGLTLAEMGAVLDAWTWETRRLGQLDAIQSVLVFENKGELMGCSNPHPHSQIWGTELLPVEMAKELARQEAHWGGHGRPLLEDYLDQELALGERLVIGNEEWVALVPFWAMWPYETLVLPRRPARTLLDLDGPARDGLASLLKRLAIRYDNLFETSFPYSMGFHQAPFDGLEHPEWTLHLHVYPPLLRSATVKKFMVGFELLGTPGRDLNPETAAEILRALPDRHYLEPSCTS